MQLTIAKNELLKQVENLYLEAFPASERKPFAMLEEMQRQGLAEILSMVDDQGLFWGWPSSCAGETWPCWTTWLWPPRAGAGE